MSKRIRRGLLILAAIVVVVGLVTAGVVLAGSGGRETAIVQRGSLEATIDTSGRIVPKNPTLVRSGATGPVAELDVASGDHVNKDDVLLKLDQGPLQAAVDQATAQRDAAQADLALHDRQFGQAQTFDRAGLQQRVRDAERAVSQAQAALDSATVKAPEAGIVVELPAVVGTPVTQGAVVAKIGNPANLELQLSLDEIDIPQVKLNDPVSFTLDAYPGQVIEGTLTRISSVAQSTANPATGGTTAGATAFPATVTFTPPEQVTPLPGMNANVTIKAAVRPNVLLIPERALRTVGSRTFVTLITPDSRQEREIQIGLRSGGKVEVASGLAEGNKILLQGS